MSEPRRMEGPAVQAVLDFLSDEMQFASFARDLRSHIAALEADNATLRRQVDFERDIANGYRRCGNELLAEKEAELAKARETLTELAKPVGVSEFSGTSMVPELVMEVKRRAALARAALASQENPKL